MSFSKLAGGPDLADSFFQMDPDDDLDKFFDASGSAGGAGGGSSKQTEKEKGGEDYKYMEDWRDTDLHDISQAYDDFELKWPVDGEDEGVGGEHDGGGRAAAKGGQGPPTKKARKREEVGRRKKMRFDCANSRWMRYYEDAEAWERGNPIEKKFMRRFILPPCLVKKYADRLVKDGLAKPDCTGYMIPPTIQVMVWLRMIARGNARDDFVDMAQVGGTYTSLHMLTSALGCLCMWWCVQGLIWQADQ